MRRWLRSRPAAQLGVWRSVDGGVTWQQRSDVNGLTGCFGDWPQNWYDQGVTVDPNDPDTLFISTVDVFRSTDGGTTFVDLTCGYAGGDVHVDHHARAYVDGDSSRLLVGSDGGVFYTANADAPVGSVAWVNLNDSISTIEFYSGDITANFATAANPGINGGAQDNGSSVKVWTGGDPGPAVWNTTHRRRRHVRAHRAGERSALVPGEPERRPARLAERPERPVPERLRGLGRRPGQLHPPVRDRPLRLRSRDLHPPDRRHAAGSGRRSTGAIPASSWYANSLDLTKGTLADRSFINQLAYAVTDNSIAIVGTNDGNVQYGFGLGQGVASSANWVNVTGGNAVLPNRPILDVATDPATPTIGYAAVGGFDAELAGDARARLPVVCGPSCSTFSWTDKSGNLPDIPVNAIAVNPHLPNQVFAGTRLGALLHRRHLRARAGLAALHRRPAAAR